MAIAPNYASNPLAPDIVQLTAANTNRDGTGTMVKVATGTAAGIVTEQLRVTATGNTTAGMIRFFLSLNSGSTKSFLTEVPVVGMTPAGTAQAFTTVVDALTGLTLQGTTTELYAATNNAETFNVFHHKAGL
ncbi:hypothetical protein [Caulobacter sp. FWC2]|uniref:hypothetical protein n=1 Tax=Caulobacter sp. FWC2 TaxID=69664 RepID=UPI000C16061E|nr:hypothetical protein [Caulobacter sp. FWC2]PIB91407.1 hypothetical protein CSW62_07340 [Caulobacter sp. FWC2]